MNKIKFLYDVVMAMKAKDMFSGTATAEVQKNQAKVFFIKNEFQKNFVTMHTKADITTTYDYEGKQLNHQSTTEFTSCDTCHEELRHKFFRHMHHMGHGCCGLKGRLSKLAYLLKLLDSIQVEEQENKNYLISLEVKDIPDGIKAHIKERIAHHDSCCNHSHCFMGELCQINDGKLSLAISVNEKHAVEKIVVTFDGIQNPIDQDANDWSIVANLELN
jgi:hypothetical protein